MNPVDFALKEMDNDCWRELPNERDFRQQVNKQYLVMARENLEEEFERIEQEEEAEHLSETKRKKLTFRRRINAKDAVCLVGTIAGECAICYGEADTKVVHNGELGDETKHDWCNFTFCWECLHKCMDHQLDSFDNIIYPKCPGCNQRICYRVTRGKDRYFATQLREFHKGQIPSFKRRVIKGKPRKNFKPKKEHL